MGASLIPGQTTGRTQQDLPVLRRAGPIEPNDRQFIAPAGIRRGILIRAEHQLLDMGFEHGGDAGEIAGDLAGTAGFPLCHGTARYADGGGQLVLRLKEDTGVFAGESVIRRLDRLAQQLGLEAATENARQRAA